jgi:hypothetical protein
MLINVVFLMSVGLFIIAANVLALGAEGDKEHHA